MATRSANQDAEIGKSWAGDGKVGKDGVITVEGPAAGDDGRAGEGMVRQGYLSPHFCQQRRDMSVVLDKPYILSTKKRSPIKSPVPLPDRVAKQGKPRW